MLPRDLKTSLFAAQIVAFGTLLRSVALDRWFTVVAASLMIVGAIAAQRNRTWGVMLSFAMAVTFAVTAFIGIAPIWFLAVAAVGAMPFVLTRDALVRFDRGAAKLLAAGAIGIGATAAVAWKGIAWSVFTTFPMLLPSRYPQHGLAVLALFVVGLVAGVAQRRRLLREQVRVGGATERVRIDAVNSSYAAAELEAEADREAADAMHVKRARSS
ncbi:MAG: hypothetical protein HOW73_23045 [Polyangiaceae bacterium]|nr:hypothetical protein [Polyangiaceae bacterium]